MDYEKKLKAALEELNNKGVWKSNANPPNSKLFKLLGSKQPPPYYRSFTANVLQSFISFTPVYGVLMWLFSWSSEGKSAIEAVIWASIAGVLFGVAMALYFYIQHRRLNLTSWKDLGGK
ncbi:DUF6404 family protein [Vibrio vulnificus]|uniref:DUF6404 family protein n=1 Tax=Vibrio vulnificus TaxID=672 RepID=UPI003242E27B